MRANEGKQERVRVLIVDDQTVVREGLAAILSTDPDIEVVGLAGNGQEALAQVPEAQPHVVLMDLKMPVLNGVQATRQLHQSHPELYVLVLTTYSADEWVFDAIRAGASGYLLKDARREELIAAIKGTVAGRTYLDPSIAGTVIKQAATSARATTAPTTQAEALTERELDVLRLLVQGHSNPEIGRRLHLASGTVRNYVSVILQKLAVSDRTQAAVEAVRRGLVDHTDT
jgi:DNA-binding NarL/FixJ family response regulator